MKKIFGTIAFLILLSITWMAFVRIPLPPSPEEARVLSETVALDFSINTMSYDGLELSLKSPIDGKGLFIEFQMGNAFKTGRPGLVIKGMKEKSSFGNGMKPEKYLEDNKRKLEKGRDFSNFMKDKKGKPIASYTFQQHLIESTDKKIYMRMTYDGPATEMIEMLEIPQPITLPAHISKRFIEKGIIQFQKGSIGFDNAINGFYIPVAIR